MAQASGQRLRIVFFGTPRFGAIALKKLSRWAGGQIVGVVSQPDRPRGRGNRICPGECASLATDLGLPLYQPAGLRAAEAVQAIAAMRPDIMVVAAYGLLIPASVLAIPPLGSLNIHASLLPAWRGAAPVARAIMENWRENATTGVSIMQVVEELDAGAVYAQKEMPIGRHTRESILDLLAEEGSDLLIETLEAIVAGTARAVPQDSTRATYAKKLSHEDGLIDWSREAARIEAQIRALWPWPVARTSLKFPQREALPILLRAAEVGGPTDGAAPGQVARLGNELRIACGDRWLNILRLCVPGKKEVAARDFINGRLRNTPDGICGTAE